uniref:Uncharacterized protein n=1 Tax=Rhizophora mucronata TaxID=61149 RepID=A0A2P2LYH1_RHIMU
MDMNCGSCEDGDIAEKDPTGRYVRVYTMEFSSFSFLYYDPYLNFDFSRLLGVVILSWELFVTFLT